MTRRWTHVTGPSETGPMRHDVFATLRQRLDPKPPIEQYSLQASPLPRQEEGAYRLELEGALYIMNASGSSKKMSMIQRNGPPRGQFFRNLARISFCI